MNTQAIDLEPTAARHAYRLLVAGNGALDPLFSSALSSLGALHLDPSAGKPEDYDLLVLDARSLPAPGFGAHAKNARAALEKNRPVLIVRPTAAHKKALADSGALHHYADGDSLALLIEPRRDLAGALRIGLAEQRHAIATGTLRQITIDDAGTVTADESTQLAPASAVDQTADDVAPFFQHVRDVVERLAGGETIPVDAQADGFGQPNLPPGNIPPSLWNVTPINLYVPLSYTPASGSYLPAGSAIWQGLITVGVYYDNTSFSKPVQWAYVEHSGSLSMPYNNTTHSGLIAQNDRDEGWSLGMLSILGNDISGPNLTSNQSSPNNANDTVSYTSSSSFQVGLSAGTDGLSGNATYEIGSSVTNDLTQWAVQKNGPDSWVFYQQVPYDGRDMSSFPNGAAGHRGAPVAVPSISAGDLDFCTQTVWIHSPADRTALLNSYHYRMNFFWYHVDSRHPIRWSATMNYWASYYDLNLYLNFGLASASH